MLRVSPVHLLPVRDADKQRADDTLSHSGVINHIRRQYITADECKPWTNYDNNENEYFITGAVVHSKYSNIQYQHLIIGNVQNFVWSHKNDFQE